MIAPPPSPPSFPEVDPFDLPPWLGEREVTWSAERGLGARHRVSGRLVAAEADDLPCDLLAVDDAYPAPVASDAVRVRAHQVWQYGEVLLLTDRGRLVLAVPGSRLGPETVLKAVGRLARAVGADAGSYGVRLRVDDDSP